MKDTCGSPAPSHKNTNLPRLLQKSEAERFLVVVVKYKWSCTSPRQPGGQSQMHSLMGGGGSAQEGGRERGTWAHEGHSTVGGDPGNADSWVVYLRQHFCPLKRGFI